MESQHDDNTHSLRALRLTPIKDVEKSPAQRRVLPTRPPLGFRDRDEGRPFGIERRKPSSSRWGWIHTAFLVGSIALLGMLAYPILFPKAVVTVTPRQASLSFGPDIRFSASKDGSSGVKYTLAPVVISDTTTVPATQKKPVEAKASGMITIRNSAIPTAQRLIKNTRFESKDGHIYRIRESVVVPGYTGTDKTPGTLDVEVFADETGAAHNLASGTLTIPGLKDKTDLFTGITAVVKTPIAGGSTGTRFVIEDKARADAVAKLDTDLLSRAQTKAQESLTQGTMTLTGAGAYSYRDIPDGEEGTNVILGREITYTQMLFTKEDMAEYLRSVSTDAAVLPDTPARIVNADTLMLGVESKKTGIDVFTDKQVTFTLKGAPELVWSIDKDAVAKALEGTQRSEVEDIFAKMPGVAKGTKLDIMPFWNNTVPRASRIHVDVVDLTK